MPPPSRAATPATPPSVISMRSTEKVTTIAGSATAKPSSTPRPLVPFETDPPPSHYCIPQELITFIPEEHDVHKYFFKGTSNQVALRQLYMHTPLTSTEMDWISEFNKYCQEQDFTIPPELYSNILRVLLFNYRKYKAEYLQYSFDHLKEMAEWRKATYPLKDTEKILNEDLRKGIVYWTGRDHRLRPLMVIRLGRLPINTSAEQFQRLVVFCFEWGLRYLFLPGKSETCSVLLDLRNVSVRSFPQSALAVMTKVLTKQYPFRLDRMWIIHNSWVVQTIWTVAKYGLTEVQREKMRFYNGVSGGFEKDLSKEFASHQLEKSFGGTRDEIVNFYPFSLAGGPFTAGYKGGPDSKAIKDCWKAADEMTMQGVIWESNDVRTPVLWSPEVARICKAINVPVPPTPRIGGNAALNGSVSQTSFTEAAEAPIPRKKSSLLDRVRSTSQSFRMSKQQRSAAAGSRQLTNGVDSFEQPPVDVASRSSRTAASPKALRQAPSPKASSPKASSPKASSPKASSPKASSPKLLGSGSLESSSVTRGSVECERYRAPPAVVLAASKRRHSTSSSSAVEATVEAIKLPTEDSSSSIVPPRSKRKNRGRGHAHSSGGTRTADYQQLADGGSASSSPLSYSSLSHSSSSLRNESVEDSALDRISIHTKSPAAQTPPAAGDRDEGVWSQQHDEDELTDNTAQRAAVTDGNDTDSSKLQCESRRCSSRSQGTSRAPTQRVTSSVKAKKKRRCKRACVIM